MRVIVQQTTDERMRESVTLGEIEFASATAPPDSLSIQEHTLPRPDGPPLLLWAAYSLLNHNLSFFISSEGVHVFTGMCHWDAVAPYFAFRLKDGSFIECYFGK